MSDLVIGLLAAVGMLLSINIGIAGIIFIGNKIADWINKRQGDYS